MVIIIVYFFLFGLSDNWIFGSKDEELFLLHQNKSRGTFISRICVPGTRIHGGVHNSLSHTKVFLLIPALSGYLNHLVLYAIGGIQIDYGIWQNLKSRLIVDVWFLCTVWFKTTGFATYISQRVLEFKVCDSLKVLLRHNTCTECIECRFVMWCHFHPFWDVRLPLLK